VNRSLLACLAILALAGAAGAADPAKGRPNVLFLFADDMRADTIAALGNPHIRTPHLDALVRRGVAFDRAYMQGGLQAATCVPSRAMLLSGQGLFKVDEKLLRDETWPEAFAKAGYDTFVTGKWHNGEKSIVRAFQEAHTVYLGGMANPLKAKTSDVEGGKVTPPKLLAKHTCEAFADEAIRFVACKHEKPFFCYVPFKAPHDPHIVPDDFPVKYDPDKLPLPANALPQHPFDNGEMTVRDEALLDWPRDPKAVRAMLADYYRYVSYLDGEIGRVLAALAKSPHADDTLVVFAADSGAARGSHGLIGKQNLYEHSVRVPLVIAGPGIPADKRSAAMCYLFDVLPTLGKRCAVPAPAASEGREFTAALADPDRPARDRLVFAYRQVQRGVRDDRWKLIRYPQVDVTQLFDLKADPAETTNLAAKPEHAAKVTDLLALLAAEQKRAGDALPLTVDKPRPPEWTPPKKKDRP
jgi:arylsulfatase A-like enzyme